MASAAPAETENKTPAATAMNEVFTIERISSRTSIDAVGALARLNYCKTVVIRGPSSTS